MADAWITAHTSAIGAGHLKTGDPCQDACVIRTSDDGEWVIIVVSDGAGTANRSREGSELVVKFFSDALLKLVSELNHRSPGHWINDFVIKKVLDTREALRGLAKSDNIKDFNCTLVACLQGPSGGFSIHIGDGAIFGSESSNTGLFVSPPENGEYANETFFITEGDWVKHLRITPMPKLDWILCCTDGGGSLAIVSEKESEPKIGFLQPVMTDVLNQASVTARNERLKSYLCDPQADKVTGDDKTLALAIRANSLSLLENFFKEYKNTPRSTVSVPASCPPVKNFTPSLVQPVPVTSPSNQFGDRVARQNNKINHKLLFGLISFASALVVLAVAWIVYLYVFKPSLVPTEKHTDQPKIMKTEPVRPKDITPFSQPPKAEQKPDQPQGETSPTIPPLESASPYQSDAQPFNPLPQSVDQPDKTPAEI
jgi:hypothetical protein